MSDDDSTPRRSMRTAEVAFDAIDPRRTALGTRVLVATVLEGVGAGELLILENDFAIVGRDPSADLVVADPGVSTRHLRIARLGPRCFVEDLRSTNGTFLNQQRIKAPELLADGDRIYLGRGTVISVRFHEPDEVAAIRRLYESSTQDALTGLYTRRHFEARLTAELAFANRHGTRVSLMLLDVDHFKRINDTYGHPSGDAVLRSIGGLLLRQVRTEDVPCRFGGEEFAIIARGIDEPATYAFAERLRNAVGRLEIHVDGGLARPTVSIGAAVSAPPDPSTCPGLVAAADRALYEAKSGGRNRVCMGR